jgi:hypothetical protein
MLWGKNRKKTIRTSDKKRKWKWSGHTIRKDPNAVEGIALDWNPHEEERKTKEDLEEISCGRGTKRRKDVEGGEVAGSGQK